MRHAEAICSAGARLIALLSLDDNGAPAFDRTIAARLAQLDIPAFACTPDMFPGIMAAAIEGRPLEGTF